jgi:hypothetical protein
MTVKPYNRQSLFDIALMQFGNIEQAFDLAVENDISLTEEIFGKTLSTTLIPAKPTIVNYYRNNRILPATVLNPDELQGGIDYMAVELNFIVA